MPLRPFGGGSGSGGTLQISFNGQVVETSASTLNFISGTNEISVDSDGAGTANIWHPAQQFASRFHTTDGTTNGTAVGESYTQRRIASDLGGVLSWGDTLQPTSRSQIMTIAPAGFIRIPDNTSYAIKVEYNRAASLDEPVTAMTTDYITGNGTYTFPALRGQVSVSSEQEEGGERKAMLSIALRLKDMLNFSEIVNLGISLVNLNTGETVGSRYETQFFWDDPLTPPSQAFAVGPNMVTPVYKQTSGVYHLAQGTVWEGQWSISRVFDSTGSENPAVTDMTAFGISRKTWDHTYFDKSSTNTGFQAPADTNQTCDMPIAFCTKEALASTEVYDWGYEQTYTSEWGWGILYNGLPDSTDLVETFGDEVYRRNPNLTPFNSTVEVATTEAIVSCGKLHNEGEDYGMVYDYPGLFSHDVIQAEYQPEFRPNATTQYIRFFPDNGTARQNGRFDFVGTAEPTSIEFSLDGVSWYDLQAPFLGGSLVDGAGAVTSGSWPSITFTTGTIFTQNNLHLRLGITAPQEVTRIELTWT